MVVQTTCIGVCPKPDHVPIVDWFQQDDGLSDAAAKIICQEANLD